MCRMMVYKGAVCLMEDLLTRPEHSIVKQSYASKERLTGTFRHRNAARLGD